MNKKITYTHICVISLLVIGILIFPVQGVFAQVINRTVRVGVYNMEGFCQHDTLSNHTGYNIDYLNKLSAITGWNYEYIETGDFKNGLTMLENKQIDLLSPSQITPERLEKFDFASAPFGTEYCSLVTLADNDSLNYEDYESFENLTVAAVRDYLITDYFIDYAQKNNFHVNLEYYDSPNEAIDALRLGKADAAIANLMTVTPQEKILARFSPAPFYYITWKGNTELLEELNFGMNDLNASYPSLQNELCDKYFPVYRERYLTRSEFAYSDSLGTLNVGYIDNMLPVSFTNAKTGEFDGMTRKVLDRISKLSGLKFHYVPLPAKELDKNFLIENNITLICGVLQNSINANIPNMKLTNPYLSLQEVVIADRDFKVDIASDTPFKVTINSRRSNMIRLMQYNNPNFTIIPYADNERCFDSVNSGESDLLILNQYVADVLLSKPKYSSLDILPVESIPEDLCLGIVDVEGEYRDWFNALDTDKLTTVLNKSISQIPDSELNYIIANESVNHKYRYTIEDFIYKYKFVFIPLSIFICMLVILLLYIVRLREQSLKLSMAEEAKLQSIANNIAGGVVVLKPDNNFIITYVNEGLLTMLGYQKFQENELLHTSFIAFVHSEDAKKLTSLEDMNEFAQNQIDLQMQIRRKDGTFIQALFSGTLTSSVSGHLELYCVIMDISLQIAIKEQLVFQQRRHELLLEKSDNIVYEADITTGEIISSFKMSELFGWQLSGQLKDFCADNFLSMWKIYKNDFKSLQVFIEDTLYGKDSNECCIRMEAHGDSYLWTKITSYPIFDSHNKLTGIIGLITEVDKEIREKEKLTLQSRTDGATGLLNKKTFLEEADSFLKKQNSFYSAVIFIDLDHFKSINDSLGHITGDKAIVDASEKIQSVFADSSLISRFGGDEFCIFISDILKGTLICKLSEAKKLLEDTYSNENSSVKISGSIGAIYNDCGIPHISTLLEAADQALYHSKELGRNCYTLWDISSLDDIS